MREREERASQDRDSYNNSQHEKEYNEIHK